MTAGALPADPADPPDRELVARILDGDRAAFAVVYDRYGGRLYDFAYATMRHREDAADAVADAFVIALERLRQLRDPDRLRPWLYAIARTECLRRLRARSRVAFGGEERMLAMADSAATPADAVATTALRDLVWDAAGGLADRDRVLLDLHLRQGLDGAELAEAMGVSVAHAYVLLSRLRDQVERSLGALLVARLGREDCPDLDRLLGAWDGALTPLIRKRVARHVEGCETCGARRRRVVSPWALLAAVPLFLAPAALRDRVLEQAWPVAAGAPVPAASPEAQPGARPALVAAAAGGIALVLLAGAALLLGGEPLASPPADPSVSSSPSETAPPASLRPGQLVVSPGVLDLGEELSETMIAVRNAGELPVEVRIEPAEPWLVVEPATLALGAGEEAALLVRADRSALEAGPVSGALRIAAGAQLIPVAVRLIQPPPSAPPRPPSVGTPFVAASPCTPSGRLVTIAAPVAAEAELDEVVLVWSIVGGPQQSVAMAPSQPNRSVVIGPFATAATISFAVEARDVRGFSASSPTVQAVVPFCTG